MNYHIEFLAAAKKNLKKLEAPIQKRLIKDIEKLSINPRPSGTKKLSGEDNTYRIRVGDYRILYHIQDHILYILILKIGHRKDVYQ